MILFVRIYTFYEILENFDDYFQKLRYINNFEHIIIFVTNMVKNIKGDVLLEKNIGSHMKYETASL